MFTTTQEEMRPERFDTWLTVDRKGLYCRPGGFHIDPCGGAKRAVIIEGLDGRKRRDLSLRFVAEAWSAFAEIGG